MSSLNPMGGSISFRNWRPRKGISHVRILACRALDKVIFGSFKSNYNSLTTCTSFADRYQTGTYDPKYPKKAFTMFEIMLIEILCKSLRKELPDSGNPEKHSVGRYLR